MPQEKSSSSTSFIEPWQRQVLDAGYMGEDRVVHFTEYLETKREEFKNLRFISSGFTSLDNKLGGLCPGEVTVVSGKTGEGKTLFCESWSRMMIKKNPGMNACVFSYEVAPWMMLEKYSEDPSLPIYLPLSLKTMDVDWLVERVREAKQKYDAKIIILDHLHFLVDMATKQNMSLNVGAFMRRLKQDIAVALNVCPILIAHQEKGTRENDPSLEGIRDSSFIAQEADNVLIVWRQKNFSSDEMREIRQSSPEVATRIEKRQQPFSRENDLYSDGFAQIQIAKARRMGTFRYRKLFQKTGDFLEEV